MALWEISGDGFGDLPEADFRIQIMNERAAEALQSFTASELKSFYARIPVWHASNRHQHL